MAGPNLIVDIDTTYANNPSDPSVELHQQAHDTIHNLLNLLDTVTGTPLALVTNSQTGTAYTLALADAGKLVEMNSASANTLAIPTNASVAFPIGTIIQVRQYGAGTTTIGGAGVTIRSRGSVLNLAGTYAEATLTKRATDEWVLIGDLA